MNAKFLYSSFQRRFPWLAVDAYKYVANHKDEEGINIYLDTGEILFYTEKGKGWILKKSDA